MVNSSNIPLARVFFVKGRSYQKLDLQPHFAKTGRVTVGYLAWKNSTDFCHALNLVKTDQQYDPNDFVDRPDVMKAAGFATQYFPKWIDEKEKKNLKSSISHNSSLLQAVRKGSFVVVPRPDVGKFYLGKIKEEFTLRRPDQAFPVDMQSSIRKIVDGPENGKKVFTELEEGKKVFTELDLHGQQWQGWDLEKLDEEDGYLRAVNLFAVPAIVRKVMASRRGSGFVKIPENYLPFVNEFLDALWHNRTPPRQEGTLGRLRFELTTSSYEHMCIEILNSLDANDQKTICGSEKAIRWLHVGGSGDGGVDGVGFFEDGNLATILQCKYEANAKPEQLVKAMQVNLDLGNQHPHFVLASLWENAAWAGNKTDLMISVIGGQCFSQLCDKYKDKISSLGRMLRRQTV